LSEKETRPDLVAKKTRSGKGLLLLVPVPELGVTINFMTSFAFVEYLKEGTLKNNMMFCKFLGYSDLSQFMSKDDREKYKPGTLNIISTEGNPLSMKARKERESLTQQITDDW